MNRAKYRSLFLGSIPFLVAVFGLILGLVQFHITGALVFFGNDTFAHLNDIALLRTGTIQVGLSTPYLLEWSVLQISQLLHTDPVRTYTLVAILSLPFMVYAVSLLASRVFGPAVGAITAVCIGIISIQPVQTYQDGTIPNIYSIGVLFPLALICLYYGTSPGSVPKRILGFLGFCAGLVLIGQTHHLTTLLVLILAICSSLVFAIWLATHLTRRRYLALVPPLLCGITTAFILLVLKPSAVIALINLAVLFHPTFPWFTLNPPASTILAWNSIRYGSDLSGALFQGGIAAAAIALYVAFKSKKPAHALMMIILVCWLCLYWLGSLTPYSVEPDRLARDFSIPSSILTAYGVWWLWKTYYPKFRLIVIMVTLVLCVSALISTRHRWDLMTNQPPALYTATDQAVADSIAQYGSTVGVYSPNFYWVAVANARNIPFIQTADRTSALSFAQLPATTCVIQLFYGVPIAGGLPDATFTVPLPLGNMYRAVSYHTASEDITRFCRTSATPKAIVIQKT